VRIAREPDGMAKLVIADDGVGQAERNIEGELPGSMGQTLIEAFTRQLGGEIAVSGPPGTVTTLAFRLESVPVAPAGERPEPPANAAAPRSREPV
jgi:two-component sensor histidine kinase